MILFPNAKINLGLNVTEKRADGYHNIETIFYPIKLCDILEINIDNTQNAMKLEISGIKLDHEKGDNLVEKAWKIMNQYHHIGGCTAKLKKVIPFGAGLGGGSADAAYCLIGLNSLFNLNLPIETLHEYAAQIGADCAFFIENKPALATGIGNLLTPATPNLKKKYLILVKPNIAMPTKDAYAGILPQKPKYSLSLINTLDVRDWKNYIKNDFEYPVFEKYPHINEIKHKLYKYGAIYASMSGSGTSVYGIFDKKPILTGLFDASTFVWEQDL